MKKYILVVIFFFFFQCITLFPDSLSTVKSNAKSDLETSIKKLSEIRSLVNDEKIPIARNVTALENKAKKLRTELQHQLRLRDNREASLIQLENEVKQAEANLDYSLNLINKYVVSWFDGNPPAEKNFLHSRLSKLSTQNSTELLRKESFQSNFKALLLSINSISETAGGLVFDGNAIVPPEGTRENGKFWSIGPSVFFSGEEGSSGFLEKEIVANTNQIYSPNSDFKPGTVRLSLGSSESSRIIKQALLEQKKGVKTVYLPLDPTLGKALIMEKGEINLAEELQKGGIWIYPILFFAILSLIIAVFKALQIARVKLPKKAASLEGHYKGPFELLRKTAHGYKGKSPEILEEILYESIIDLQVKLEKALPLIAVTAATAPLLGLLGTVTGMIDVFRQITNFANPENSELARGISEALVTTKFGLITAIPSLIVHALLTRRLQGIISKMEGFSARLVRLKKEIFDRKSDESDI